MSQENVCIRRQIFVQSYAFRHFSMDLCNCEILKIASIRALPYINRDGFFLFFYFTEIVEVKNKSKELYYYNYYYDYYNYSVIVLSRRCMVGSILYYYTIRSCSDDEDNLCY